MPHGACVFVILCRLLLPLCLTHNIIVVTRGDTMRLCDILTSAGTDLRRARGTACAGLDEVTLAHSEALSADHQRPHLRHICVYLFQSLPSFLFHSYFSYVTPPPLRSRREMRFSSHSVIGGPESRYADIGLRRIGIDHTPLPSLSFFFLECIAFRSVCDRFLLCPHLRMPSPRARRTAPGAVACSLTPRAGSYSSLADW